MKSAQMMRRLLVVLTVLVLAGACSKKTQKETTEPGDTTNDANISAAPMSFNAQGSDSGTIEGLATVHFDYDSATLSAEGKKQLSDNAAWIKNHAKVTMQIEGHCDERGSIEYNLALGERRAKSVKAYLVTLGVEGKRLTVISFGKEKPVAQGDSEEVFAKNRRANFVPLPQ